MPNSFNVKYANVVKNFNVYMEGLDAYVKERTSQFDEYFNEKETFFRVIFYVIQEFLCNDELEELFIKLPVNELATKSSEQIANWTQLQDVINFALSLATLDQQRSMVAAPSLELSSVGKLVYCRPSSAESDSHRFFEISQKGDFVYPSDRLRGRKTRTNYKEALNTYTSNMGSIYKLTNFPSQTKHNRPYTGSFKGLLLSLNSLNSLFKYDGFVSQFNSAHIIGFNDSSKIEDRLYHQDYFETPVAFSSKYDTGCNKEIICFVGDRKYHDVQDDVSRALGQRKTNKVIYLGSELEGFTKRNTRAVFEFSIRELYYYFTDVHFPEIAFEYIRFPWLEGKIAELTERHPNQDLKPIITYALRHCMGISMIPIRESDIRNFDYYLFDNFNLDDDVIDDVEEWYSSLSSDSPTPKFSFYDSVRCSPNGQKHRVPPYSYINEFKSFLKKYRNSGSHAICFDVYADSKAQVDVVRNVLKFLPLGKIYFMSYIMPMRIQEYFLEEPYVCNSDFRKKLFEGLLVARDHEEISHYHQRSELDDYLLPNVIDEFLLDAQHMSEINQSRYQIVTAEGMRKEYSGGDVLLGDVVVPISDICSYQEEYHLPCEITYYKSPEDFDKFICVVHNFAIGKDVAYYSRLWKERLRQYSLSYDGNLSEMRREQFPFLPQRQMRNYVNPESSLSFPHKFKRLVKSMHKLALITKDEHDFLLRAYKADNERSKHGRFLKKELFHYKITGNKGEYLLDFDKKAAARGEKITSDCLFSECLQTHITTEIKQIL